MLDLHARVHLDEEEGAVLDQELEGANAPVADLAARLRATRADGGHEVGRETRRRRLLQHLLVPALQRAVAAAEPERAALPVGENLDLDMARPAEELLDVDLGIAEGAARLFPREREGFRQAAPPQARRACRGRRRRPPPSG